MASLTITISRVDDVGDSICVGAHYTTDTGLSGSRSIEIPKAGIATGADLEREIIDEVKRHCEAKWGLSYNVLSDRVIFFGRIEIRP